MITNLLGTETRICRAFGLAALDDLTDRVAELVRPSNPESWFEKLRAAPTRAEWKRSAPRTVKSGVCQQVVRLGGDVDLRQFPALQSRPLEFGRTITAAQVISSLPGSVERTVARHDLCLLDRDRLAVAWLPHEDHARLVDDYRRRREAMPLAVVLGGHPAALLAAMAPLPPDSDRLAFAGLLRGQPLETVRCRTLDLEVGADAEIVLEGKIDPQEPPHETGPLAGPGGFYQDSRPAPVMQVTAVTHRVNPIFPAMVPGYPGDEPCVLAATLQRWLLPLVRSQVPELVAYHFPRSAASRYCGFVSIRKSYAGQARKVASALWGMAAWMHVKLWILVDEEVNPAEAGEIWAAISAHVDPGRDLFVQQGPPDPLDPAAAANGAASRMTIDATAKLAGEGGRATPGRAEMPEQVWRLVSSRWSEYGIGEQR